MTQYSSAGQHLNCSFKVAPTQTATWHQLEVEALAVGVVSGGSAGLDRVVQRLSDPTGANPVVELNKGARELPLAVVGREGRHARNGKTPMVTLSSHVKRNNYQLNTVRQLAVRPLKLHRQMPLGAND